MIRVTAIRGAGDSPGDDITEALLTTYPAAIERARVELDKGALQIPVRVECTYQASLKPGDLVSVYDAALGAVWTGTLQDIQHTSIRGGAISTLTLLYPDG